MKAVWKYGIEKSRFFNDTLYLSRKDINHLERVYTKFNVEPESFDEVVVEFLFDREKLIRYIIKELDILLNVGGLFKIKSTLAEKHGYAIRSESQIKYEFSISLGDKYHLKKKKSDKAKGITELEYSKIKNTLKADDSINKWSFGTITDGRNVEKIDRLITSIIKQSVDDFEIVICGPYENKRFKSDPIRVIPDVSLEGDIRAPISAKKNLIAKSAVFENLMILHDRYEFPENWYQKMVEYGNYFDLLTMPNVGPNGKRVNDWLMYNKRPSDTFKNPTTNISYSSYSNSWYAQGGVIISKKSLYLDVLLDEKLHWGEMEDIQFSQIGYLKGWFFYLDRNNSLLTYSDRLSELNDKSWAHKIRWIKRAILYLPLVINQLAKHFISRM